MNINSTLYSNLGGQAPETQSRLPIQTLDQSDFLKLLVTQLSAQDPLNPKKDTDFIAQMAQFSTLEHSKSMLAGLAQLQRDQKVLQANSLLGRTVGIDNGPEGSLFGVVESVRMQEGTPTIVVNGQGYDLGRLLNITPAAVLT